jgi:hypothetical protein
MHWSTRRLNSRSLHWPPRRTVELGVRDTSTDGNMKRKRLGEVLLERGKISPAKLQHLIEEQNGKLIRLGELILERGLVEKPALAGALEEVFHISYVDCSTVECE